MRQSRVAMLVLAVLVLVGFGATVMAANTIPVKLKNISSGITFSMYIDDVFQCSAAPGKSCDAAMAPGVRNIVIKNEVGKVCLESGPNPWPYSGPSQKIEVEMVACN